jgi:hypothetical protein
MYDTLNTTACPRWSIKDVPDLLSRLETVGNKHGFLVCVYGSTARVGEGRDLDLICVQKRIGVIPRYFLEDVALHLRARIEHRESSLFAELCGLLRMEDGRLIDIQIRLSRCGPQDALEMYEGGLSTPETKGKMEFRSYKECRRDIHVFIDRHSPSDNSCDVCGFLKDDAIHFR